MSTAGLPRHLLKWVLGLDLTYPIKHPKRDFANGFLVAEVLSKYFPDDIKMHSFENVTSIKRKKSNWHVLLKFFKRYSIPVSEQDTEDVMAAASGAIVKVLQTVYDYVHEDPSAQQAETVSMQSPGYDLNTAYSPEAAAAQQAMQQPMFDYPAPQYGMQQPLQALPEQHVQFYPEQLSQPYMQQPTAGYPSQAPPAQMQPMNSPYGHNIGRPIQGHPGDDPYAPYAAVQASYPQQQPHSVQWQQPYGDMQPAAMQQPYAAGYMQSMAVAGAATQGMQYGAEYAGQYQGAPTRPPHTAASTSAPSIEYDRRPRPVEYKPYTQQDYASRNYDAKSQKEYWQLGTLGAQIDDEELQAKRRKAEELKELARSIREKNARLASMSTASARPKADLPKSKSVREKALDFARNVPIPDRKQSASPGSSTGERTPKQQQQQQQPENAELTEMEKLQAQHAAHRQKVESIRREFVRMASK